MKNMISIRNSLIILLCCTVIFMGVGFMVLSVELKKERERVSSYQVEFSKIEQTSSVKGDRIDPVGNVKIEDEGLSLNMDFHLNAIYDELTYVVTIHNDSTMDAKIIKLLESPNYSEERFQKLISPIEITISDIEGKVIPAGGDLDFKIIVYYPPNASASVSRTIPYRIGLLSESVS